MAQTAGDAAAYEVALPIAQADAATFAKSASYNTDQRNQFAVRNVDSENQFRLTDRQAQQQRDTQRELAQINRETQLQVSQLDANNRATAERLSNENRRVLEGSSQAAQTFNTAMSAINNIQNNNQMSAETKRQAINNIWRDVQVQLRTLGGILNVNLSSQLNFAGMDGFDSNGNWVGLGNESATTTTPAPAPAPVIDNTPAGA